MIRQGWWCGAALILLAASAVPAWADGMAQVPMNADSAVRIALTYGSDAIRSRATIQDATGNYWGAANGVLPSISLIGSRSGNLTQNQPITLATIVGTQVV